MFLLKIGIIDSCCPGLEIDHYDRTKTTQYVLFVK